MGGEGSGKKKKKKKEKKKKRKKKQTISHKLRASLCLGHQESIVLKKEGKSLKRKCKTILSLGIQLVF